jgi:glutamine synthetase
MTPKQVVECAKENGALMVDYKFMDFVGTWQHVSVPMTEFGEDTFEEGQGFDGSSIRGWQPIHASDMILLPDPTTAKMDPFVVVPTLSIICDIFDPITKEDYTRDPRNIAKKAEMYLKSTGIGDTAFFGPEAEFFIFDDIRFDGGAHFSFYQIDSVEGIWNTGREENPSVLTTPTLELVSIARETRQPRSCCL